MLIWPSAVVLVASVMLTSTSGTLYQFIVTQGVLGGIGISVLYTPCVAVLGHYFLERRFLAIGISSAGTMLVPRVAPRKRQFLPWPAFKQPVYAL